MGNKVKGLSFQDKDYEVLSLKKFPIFSRNSVKESFYKRVSKIEFDEENIQLADKYSDKTGSSLYLGYPFYYSQSKELIPVFFMPVSLSKEHLNVYSLWAYNDYVFINEKFIKTFIEAGQEHNLKSFLKLFLHCDDLDLSSIDNVEINLKEFSMHKLLSYLKLTFSFDFDDDFKLEHLRDKLDLTCENCFFNNAFIFNFNFNSIYPEFLNKILVSDDEVLDKTSLSCFSNTFVKQDKSIDPFCDENYVVGENLSSINFDYGAKRAVLYSSIDPSNNLCIIKNDLPLSDLINAILLNFCFAEGAFAYAKSSGLLEKSQNAPKDNLNDNINKKCYFNFFNSLLCYLNTEHLKAEGELNKFYGLSILELDKKIALLKRFLSHVDNHNDRNAVSLSNLISFNLLYKFSLDKKLKQFIFKKKNQDNSIYLKRAHLLYNYLFLEKTQRLLNLYINKDEKQEELSSNLKSFLDKGFSEKYISKDLNLASFKAGKYKKSILVLDKDFSLPLMLSVMFMSQSVTFIAKEDDVLTKSESVIPNCFELVNKLCIDDECGIIKNDLTSAQNSEDFSMADSLSYLATELQELGAQANFDLSGFIEVAIGEQKVFINCNYSFDEESHPQNEFEFALKDFLTLSKIKILMVNKCAAEFNLKQYAEDIYSELKGGDFK